ncbi:hemolysin III family protein [Galbibacter sp. PAP.153]|uniref:PAQR family membrane homeostasis protein TrhA n=1 Tax=Galbibacter sp. PAP.153 TaxID=3104623 RepID=UPI00300B19EA
MDQSPKEEFWNTLTHGFGVLLAIFGFFVLLSFNSHKTDFSILSICVYSFSSVLLFTVSTLYHLVDKIELKTVLRKLDHISIYVLIAGTYTPVCLVMLVPGNGWILFYIVWAITFMGIVLKIFFTGKFEALSLLLYLAMGWLIVFDIHNLMASFTSYQLLLLMLGGLFYTVGIVFYAINKIPYNHVIWHLFVLAGAISHYLMILSII